MVNIKERKVFLVDNELRVLEVLRDTLQQLNVNVTCFSRAADCLEQLGSSECDLLITDLKMPQMDGLELLQKAKQIVPWLPILLITGYGDIPTAVTAIQSGAVDFVEKPLQKISFLQKVESLLQKNDILNSHKTTALTEREIKILRLVIEGKSSREIATLLHRSIRTVEVHRSRVMRKLGVDNLIQLIRKAAALGLVEMPEKIQELEESDNNETAPNK